MISWFCSPWWILPWECRILLRLLTSQLLSIICTALFTADVKYGMGKHAAYLTPHELMQAVKINFIPNPFGVMAYSLPNISVVIFLNRILAPNRARKITLYTITVAQSVIAAISLIILFAHCHPTEFLWNPDDPSNLFASFCSHRIFIFCWWYFSNPWLLVRQGRLLNHSQHIRLLRTCFWQ